MKSSRSGPGFWYSLGTRKSMGPLEWIGLFVLFAAYLLAIIGVVVVDWQHATGSLWKKAMEVFALPALVALFVVVILVSRTSRTYHSLYQKEENNKTKTKEGSSG